MYCCGDVDGNPSVFCQVVQLHLTSYASQAHPYSRLLRGGPRKEGSSEGGETGLETCFRHVSFLGDDQQLINYGYGYGL